MNELIIDITNKTPIEIALGVDSQGMTTARRLYEFLELNPANYARWTKANITDNEFADENVDYWAFIIDDERNPKPTTDFKLTARFAKKLSMKGIGQHAEEAREYFTRLEEMKKQELIDRRALSPQMQLTIQMAEDLARTELAQKRQAEELERLEEKTDRLTQTFVLSSGQNWRAWVNKCLSTVAESQNYYFIGTPQERHREAREESYERLSAKRSCNLRQRVKNEKARAAEAGASQTRINAINKLTIIENDKDLKPIYETVIKEMMIAYCGE